jgi:hypothetical protein
VRRVNPLQFSWSRAAALTFVPHLFHTRRSPWVASYSLKPAFPSRRFSGFFPDVTLFPTIA